MTLETQFDPRRNLIFVGGTIDGPRGTTELRLVLDTGASMTLIVPEVLEDIGYSSRDGDMTTSVSTALGKEQGYTVRVARFATLGFAMSGFSVHVFDLAERDGIDGLIGLSFLRRFNYEVRSSEGRILVSNIGPLAA
jgi:clan AA aspartic protease (TIGR02281 family)